MKALEARKKCLAFHMQLSDPRFCPHSLTLDALRVTLSRSELFTVHVLIMAGRAGIHTYIPLRIVMTHSHDVLCTDQIYLYAQYEPLAIFGEFVGSFKKTNFKSVFFKNIFLNV